ncbi:hypothetical protein GCM10009117_01880 [Gangjinia marincola]|uniref:Outer membrane protein beta-barrel domain-containing protein n=1 Tax=Gangjinia marincola TaxID=578463 RepID=A0ABP3XSB0_9FLAO
MKKTMITALFVLGAIGITSAQEISKNAIGLRLGDSDGFGTELSYQRGIGDNNRLEFGLGWRSNNNFDAYRIVGLYQWVFNLDKGFNWYVGAGGGFGQVDFDDDFDFPGRDDDSDTFAFVAGDIGLEYNFDFPLLLSLDFRPELGFNDYNDDLDLDIALGIRYQF